MAKGGMTMDDLLARSFQGGEKARDAYVKSFEAYSKAIQSLSKKDKEAIFGANGEIFYNAEIQGPLAKNVINYDSNVINIHRMGHKKYNPATNDLEIVQNKKESAALDAAVDQFEADLSGESFNVRRTAFLELNKMTDETIVNQTLSRLRSAGLDGDVTIYDLLERELMRRAKEDIPELDIQKQQMVVDRILKKENEEGNKDYLSLTQIGKGLGRTW